MVNSVKVWCCALFVFETYIHIDSGSSVGIRDCQICGSVVCDLVHSSICFSHGPSLQI